MALLPLVPETSASTDSATSASVARAREAYDLFTVEILYPKGHPWAQHGKEVNEKTFSRIYELMPIS